MGNGEGAPESGTVPHISVIIPAKNAAGTIADQLDALACQTFAGPFEVLIADNGSSDDTLRIVESYRDRVPDLRVIDASSRPGSAFARNEAARSARGGLLCFCDADDVVDAVWLDALKRCAESQEIVGGRLDVETLNEPHVRAWRSAPQASRSLGDVTFAPSGNMAISSKLFHELRGFDVEYLKSHDVEFSARAVAAGHTIGFCPEAVVAYRLRADLNGLARQAFRAGRATAQAFADGQASPRSIKETVQDWAWLVIRVPTLASRMRRGIWVRRAAQAMGRLVGSVRWRVVYL